MVDDSGGAGGYGSMVDWSKIIHSLVSNDGRLLTSKMVDEIFRPQLGEFLHSSLGIVVTEV